MHAPSRGDPVIWGQSRATPFEVVRSARFVLPKGPYGPGTLQTGVGPVDLSGMRGSAGIRLAAVAALAAVAVAGAPAGAAPAALSADRPTSWSALNAVIADIPTYRPGAAEWLVSGRYDFWATADWYQNVIYVNPTVPVERLYDVVVHEWSHLLSVQAYDGNVRRAKRAMNRWFGGRHLVGAERAADCMTRLQGASWTHYTACQKPRWRHGARRLLNGRPLVDS